MNALEVRFQHEVLRIEPWGADSVRVRSAREAIPSSDVGALTDPPPSGPVTIDGGKLVNGELTVLVDIPEGDGFPFPVVRFVRTSTGEELLAEEREHFWWPGARVFYGNRSGAGEVHQQFKAYPGERLYGMGQRTHGRLDHKGLALDLVQRNAEVSIPFVLSNRGYGFLWNNPAVGRVEFADNVTRWTASQARGIDYWMTAGSPAAILARYADATGHAPRLPSWASGFWQCKLRYRNQEELLSVAREHKRRGLPLEVIVTDFFHWTAMGDYKFDPAEYPDPAAMMAELSDLGVRLMVSIWPTISPLSENYETLRDGGMLVGTDQGAEFHATIRDKGMAVPMPIAFHDPTNPRTREFLWSVAKKNYFDLGVRVWWLDACEPELNPGHPANLAFHAGPGAEVANIYPRETARMFAEGMAAAGDPETVLLCRSAWAGSQKYSAAVWSGDIPATWESLRRQVRAGLSIAIAGIPWWTTDIGGFHGGDASDEDFRELIVRWFQYGAFCPLFRLHGNREPRMSTGWDMTGGPNEVWAFGDTAYPIIKSVMEMRERLRPYLHQQLDRAASEGLPAMRPLFVDFPDDEQAWDVDDQLMFGPDVLVAPVLEAGARARSVYLPRGSRWTHVWSGQVLEGGTTIEADAPLHEIPVYLRDGAVVPVAG
ncbi:glycoside hydrolase family 31 protein [Cryptosporangium aurantiacum]|uniref:Alpha-D-xyloside xylohydrolase n=1 Tax=Cryptosporangium aurantiacum TaxID=134849 RepID=A0A1M7R8H4_9ACTN|nr:glycoside hydrolase family 31 protein [Cryptosporangium aurantiacum]SHN42624.1 alpha-D-xyloside xylohydrolase [Cryptosporangium aurantiacum]